MYVVYKITNQINQKVYIGSSIRCEKRWQQHKNAAFNPNNSHYNYPLYQSFRKYGVDNFKFEILKNDFLTEEEMQDYEKQMIIFYNSLAPNGYNQVIDTNNKIIAKTNTKKHTQKISKRCALVDENNNILEIYSSYHDAARKQGWDGDSRASSVRKICMGQCRDCSGLIFRLLDENGNVIVPEIKTRKRKTSIYGINKDDSNDIVYYESISEAARAEKIDRSSISKCLAGSTRYKSVGGRIWKKESD